MSTQTQSSQTTTEQDQITEMFIDFLSDYYKDEIAEMAQKPREKPALWVDYSDVWSFNPELAQDLREKPDDVLPLLEEAIDLVDVPLDVDLSEKKARIHNLNDEHIYEPGEIRQEHAHELIGVEGVLERVTSTSYLPREVVYECKRCPDQTIAIEQSPTQDQIEEPYECPSCNRSHFERLEKESEYADYAKIRIQSKPSSDSDGKLPGFILNDLIDVGGEMGVVERAGEPVVMYGIIKPEQKNGRGSNKLLFDPVLDVNSIEFIRDNDTVDIEAHRDEFERIAEQPNAVDQFAESIAPHLHTTDAWDVAMEFAVAYLFGSPRIDLDDGPTYRGDLHFLIISDYGMGKSDFKTDIEKYSPKCINKSVTALSSGVGLTAAAVKDDFGEGQWTLKPGLLVRANGGHLLLDEIDKGPDELTDMNDALEGSQVVDVEKAGMNATYESRTALMALGNPIDGRFDPSQPVPHQLGISESLLSRFDGIVTMEDTEDIEQDKEIASTFGRSFTEAQEKQYGEREEFENLDRNVPIDVGQAWIKHARENVNPIFRYEQYQELEDWYAKEVRQLNKDFASNGDGEDMPVPATVRVLGAVTKMAIAFARARLKDEVGEQQVERAKKLGKKLVKQNWNGESFDAVKDTSGKTGTSQGDRIDEIKDTCGGETLTVSEIAGRVRRDFERVREDLKTMQGREAEKVNNNRYRIKEIQ